MKEGLSWNKTMGVVIFVILLAAVILTIKMRIDEEKKADEEYMSTLAYQNEVLEDMAEREIMWRDLLEKIEEIFLKTKNPEVMYTLLFLKNEASVCGRDYKNRVIEKDSSSEKIRILVFKPEENDVFDMPETMVRFDPLSRTIKIFLEPVGEFRHTLFLIRESYMAMSYKKTTKTLKQAEEEADKLIQRLAPRIKSSEEEIKEDKTAFPKAAFFILKVSRL